LALVILKSIIACFLLLFIGDFLSTFCYHVPEHVFGKFHLLVHHSKNRSFIHYAVLNKNPLVILDGLLGALPYLIFIPWLWQISPFGTIVGVMLGEFHVIWRHVSILDWKTPVLVERFCNILGITTPEKHWLHHQDGMIAYGDIFVIFDQPAQKWLHFLLTLKKKFKKSFTTNLESSNKI
jgi:hypothetical protein